MLKPFQSYTRRLCNVRGLYGIKGFRNGATLCISHELADRKRDQPFSAGKNRNPLICLGCRLRHPCFKLDEVPALFGVSTTHLCIFAVVGHRRKPGLKEVRTKGKYQIRITDIEERHARLTQKIFGSLTQCSATFKQASKSNRSGCTDGACQISDKVKQMIRSWPQ